MDSLIDATGLRTLIQQYGRMKKLEGYTPQSRGRALNTLLAKSFRCWGIRADSDQRSRGEIDVQLALASSGQRLILEAKWENAPTDTGVIAKLQKRVRQRLSGTLGLVASMSGFSEEAIADVKDGERLEVLLLDGSHVEAMLSGFMPPNELLERLVDHAAFTGSCHVSVKDLLSSRDDPGQSIEFVERPPPVSGPEDQLIANVILGELPPGQGGLAVPEPNRLWVTTSVGLLDVDLREESVSKAVDVPDLHRSAMVTNDGAPLALRKAGAARVKRDGFEFVAGGLTGNSSFVVEANGEWIFCNSRTNQPDERPGALLVKQAGSLGTQTHLEVDYPSAHGTNAGLTEERFIIVGNGGVLAVDLQGEAADGPVRFPAANPMGMMRDAEGHWLVAADGQELYELDVETQVAHRYASLDGLRGSVGELAARGGGPFTGYLFTHPREARRPCVLEFAPR